jgi:fructosamine-3-kinase
MLGLGEATSIREIYTGDWAEVYRIITDTGAEIAAKCPSPGYEWLAVEEGRMLDFLSANAGIPVPRVLGIIDDQLFLAFIRNDGRGNINSEREAGRHLAALHGVNWDHFGFPHDTIFGPIKQPNQSSDSWPSFFREQRLAHMSQIAHQGGRIDTALLTRIEQLMMHLEEHIEAPDQPALVHGDFWGGNVLNKGDHCVAFIDPAIYFGHPEVDLSFATLFGSFGQAFFDGYRENRAIEPGFEQRIGIYNLWPLLFHAYWFGGGYAQQVNTILRGLGY